MLSEKKFIIANFNCTFGDNNIPFMDNFVDVIYPAVTDGYKRKEKGNEYFFYDVKLIEINKQKDIALIGAFVKDTKIEINSRYTNNVLMSTEESYQSSPYSIFAILLKNHRMLYMKNQKGSPQLSVFETTFRECLTSYINIKINEKNKENPNINIVSIPSKLKVRQKLEDVDKIKELKIRFYPLNGDIPNNLLFNSLREDIMIASGSKSANLTVNSPKEKEVVITIVEDTEGTAATSMKVKYKNGNNGLVKENSFTEEFNLQLEEASTIEKKVHWMADKVAERDEFYGSSSENLEIFLRNKDKLFLRYGDDVYEFTRQ